MFPRLGAALLIASLSMSAHAATLHVRTAGSDACDGIRCAKRTIQSAIAAAQAGDEIRIHPGTFAENVVIDKAVTLRGAGQDRTVVVPAVSKANPCPDGGSLCEDDVAVILVRASGVTITSLTVDGDNPQLTSGLVFGGADMDARDGIIDDWPAGVFDDLHVSYVTVRNVFLRGIQAGSGGKGLLIEDCHVSNVNGHFGSMAIANILGAGDIVRNTVEDSNAGILANASAGTRFLHNRVRRSGVGVETDYAGAAGGVSDLMEGNVVSDCTGDLYGYGMEIYVPTLAVTARGNQVQGCKGGFYVQAAATGAGVNPLSDNVLVGDASAGSIGLLVTTDSMSPDGILDVAASSTGDRIRGFETGVLVRSNGASASLAVSGDVIIGNATGLDTDGTVTLEDSCLRENGTALMVQGAGTLAAHWNDLVDTGALLVRNLGAGTVDAAFNWWGSRRGPDASAIEGSVVTVPFLRHPAACGCDAR